ncbi:DUF461 domain-containing protein [Streptomyces tateyamensis]|uniref:DUF461 domain-containing protein n=1 Tax=Streptomyces tateyamensis TaxID=565073 RepID=UPI0011B4E6F8|nr:DUF461 domain-containing protein [Streptomyces tateyamensis]
MSRSLRRGGTAAIVLALAAVSLSACSAGTSSESTQVKPNSPATALGPNLRLNAINVVVSPTQTTGQNGPANVTLNISNIGSAPETLQSVTIAGGTATFLDANGAPLPGGVVIPASGAVLLGGTGQPSARVASVALPVGGYAPASFSFSTAGKVDTTAAVVSASGIFESFGPTTASPSASASGSASASASPSASASASGSTSPSATPSGAASGSASASSSASAGASAH